MKNPFIIIVLIVIGFFLFTKIRRNKQANRRRREYLQFWEF